MRPRNPRNSTLKRMTATSVMMRGAAAASWKLCHAARGEVEADQRDDRAGDDRRHERVDPAGAGDLHDEADGGEQDADGDDADEGRLPGAAARRRRRVIGAMNANDEPR